MRPSRRAPMSKGRSAVAFRRNISRTKVVNLTSGPMRGGIRL